MRTLPDRYRLLVGLFSGGVLAFLMLPIFAVIPASFNDASFIYLPPRETSLRWYETFFSDREWATSLATSAKVAVLATTVALVLGTLAALGLHRTSGKLRAVLTGLFLSPLIVPVIVIAVALYYVSQRLGLVGTVLGMALGHTLLCLPFVVINVSISLRALDPTLLRAAEGLGAAPSRTFRTVTLPIILPGVLSGGVFAFITSFDEVVIAVFLAGYQAKTLPVKMWETIRLEFTPVVAVGACLLIALTVILFAVARLVKRRSEVPEE